MSEKIFDYVGAHKGKDGYGYKYADLGTVAEALSDASIQWRQETKLIDGQLYVLTSVKMQGDDKFGEFGSPVPVIFVGNAKSKMSDMQALGSAITYARRYSLQIATNVIPDDDDGASAGNQATRKVNGNTQSSHINQAQWMRLKDVCMSLNLDPHEQAVSIIGHDIAKPLDITVDEYDAIMSALGAKK